MQDLSELLTKQVQDLVDNPKPAINKPVSRPLIRREMPFIQYTDELCAMVY
jgi:hypothetical protein